MRNNNLWFSSALTLVLALFFCACGAKPEAVTEEKEVAVDTLLEEEEVVPKAPRLTSLINLPLDQLKFISTYAPEAEGDCSSIITRYAKGDMKLVIDSTDCYDYGTYYYFYLLDERGELQMAHTQSVVPFIDYETEEFFYELKEEVADFQGEKPVLKMRIDTVSQSSPETEVRYNDNYTGKPWVVVNAKGDDTVFGKTIDYKGNWYATTKKAVKARLMELDVLPRPIPITFNGELGMGTRGEFRSLGEEALTEVASLKAYELRENYDQFSRLKGPLKVVADPGDKGTLTFWARMMPQG